MKRKLLLFLPALFLLGGCSLSQAGEVDPYAVTKQQAIDAFNFKDLSNLTVDYNYFVSNDRGTDDEYVGTHMTLSYMDNLTLHQNHVSYTHYVTTKNKYKAYCESQQITYSDQIFEDYLQSFRDYGCDVTNDGETYTIKDEWYCDSYYKKVDDYCATVAKKVIGKDSFRQVNDFVGEEPLTEHLDTLFDTNYINPALFTYHQDQHYYDVNENSLGGIILPDFLDDYLLDTYTINSAKVFFENRQMKKLDINISGQRKGVNRTIGFALEVRDTNQVSFVIPEATPEACLHTYKYYDHDEDAHFQICEDCESVFLGSGGKCTYDANGDCTVCGNSHYNFIYPLTYSYFGYPAAVITSRYCAEKKDVSGSHFEPEDSWTVPFDYFILPNDTKYYDAEDAATNGTRLWNYCGNTTVIDLDDSTMNLVIAKEYTFEVRKYLGEDHNVMVISELHCPVI